MVSGLVIQTSPTDIGMLLLANNDSSAATNICIGIGKNAQKMPTKKARLTERRVRCHNEGS